jgi:hypothetical protein
MHGLEHHMKSHALPPTTTPQALSHLFYSMHSEKLPANWIPSSTLFTCFSLFIPPFLSLCCTWFMQHVAYLTGWLPARREDAHFHWGVGDVVEPFPAQR